MKNNNKELLLKKLLYRSIHRGCKETDILLGEFAKAELEKFNDEQIETYKNFMEEDDLMIYDWILDKENFPEEYEKLIYEIRKFHNL